MSEYSYHDDGNWNESQWERHISDVEKKSSILRKFVESSKYENLPSWVGLMDEMESEFDVVDEFVDRELELEEAYYPDDDDDDFDDDDFDEDLFLKTFKGFSVDGGDIHMAFNDAKADLEDDDEDDGLDDDDDDEDFLFDDDDDDDFDHGEEWKMLSDEFADTESGSILTLSIYTNARNLAALCVQEIEPTMVMNYPLQYIQFVDAVMHVASKIASGYSFGFEADMIGGNLVYTKKALENANNGLALLQRQKKQSYIVSDVYLEFHKLLFELRNEVALYVHDLRNRFLAT